MTDKEKLEKALAHLKKFIDGDCVCDSDILADFPELKDSEDERIRKSLIDFFGEQRDMSDVNGVYAYEVVAWLEKQKEQKPAIIKPHKGDDGNPYDMGVSEAQEYAIKRGFGIPFNDGEVFVDERYITQTIGNILRWADEHPKEQKPAEWSEENERKMDMVTDALHSYWSYNKFTMLVSWLKSLRPHWKPSEEQMEALERAIVHLNTPDDIPTLTELRDNLKKL